MTNTQDIETVLTRMAELLRLGCHEDWADALVKHQIDLVTDPLVTSAKILAMYGGMGSINDLILYKDGQLLLKETNEFDALRSQLNELCRKVETQ
jgi:hypothetical protein